MDPSDLVACAAVVDDFQLLIAWRAGDKAAGNMLFERHFDALYRFFRNKVSAPADDLVQQTLLACVKARDSFRGTGTFRSFLFSVARNKLYTHLSQHHREQQHLDWGETSCADLGISPSGMLVHNEQQRVLLSGLRRLPLDLQIALELYYFEQIRGPQLAEVLGIPEGTVRSRIRRAQRLLRESIDELSRSPGAVETTATDLEGWALGVRQNVLVRS